MIKKYQTLFFVIGGLIITLELSSCKDNLPTEADLSTIVLPDSGISYGAHMQRLWNAACVGCHYGSGSYDPDLTAPNSYQNIMNFPTTPLVIPRRSDISHLARIVQWLEQPVMPPSAPRFNQNQINGIKKWIDEGAQNN